MKRTIIYISLFLIGLILGIIIMGIPSIRYDFNNNGKVDISDFLKYHNYYIEH